MYKIVKTKDGSLTIISPTTGDTYHSMGGEISESNYVYIKNGLLKKLKDSNKVKSINILEVGFGTGLNCYLTRLN
jgi:tRNA U34 5-methylaminomethyl-2-thiouridine-forming methyltransferase MnmC